MFRFAKGHSGAAELMAKFLTLMFIAFQTLQMNFNISEIKKSITLDAHEVVHRHKQNINEILINSDPDLSRSIFQMNKPQVVGFTLINDYESLFNMRSNGLITDDRMWTDVETMIYNTLMRVPYMKTFWEENKPAVNAKFAQYVENLTISDNHPNYGEEKKFFVKR